jgi:4-alpha-glucanotransferase
MKLKIIREVDLGTLEDNVNEFIKDIKVCSTNILQENNDKDKNRLNKFVCFIWYENKRKLKNG